MADALHLDDLYKMVAHIYSEKNANRSSSATFSHFVEVCGLLTIHERKKKRENVTVTDALCKALGWYFPLLAKFNIASVEDIVFRKFPYACPYCRRTPHRDDVCKLVRGTSSTVDHAAVNALYLQNHDKRPVTLNDWQRMFQDIYPREAHDTSRSIVGLMEELGELAEAIRVYEKHPKYFLGEAADTFSYIMGIANELSLRLRQDHDENFSLEDEFLKRFPGLCIQCGSRVCSCPAVPEATVGRMAKELDIAATENLFIRNPTIFDNRGREVCQSVLERLGGYRGLTNTFPFDRGDTNRALTMLCLKLADVLDTTQPNLAAKLRAEALRIFVDSTYPGSPKKPFDVTELLQDIRQVWDDLDNDLRESIKIKDSLVGEIAEIIQTRQILFVGCSPIDEDALRVAGELRTIQQALSLGKKGSAIHLTHLPGATIGDLRRAVLGARWDVIHFSGHGDQTSLTFETSESEGDQINITAIAALLNHEAPPECVILNACHSAVTLSDPIGRVTVGMQATIADAAAVEFSAGFYDALAAGKNVDVAITVGINAVQLKGLDASPIKVLRRT